MWVCSFLLWFKEEPIC